MAAWNHFYARTQNPDLKLPANQQTHIPFTCSLAQIVLVSVMLEIE